MYEGALATPKDPLLRADKKGPWWCEQPVLPRERFDSAIIRPTTGGKSQLLLGTKGALEEAMSVPFANADAEHDDRAALEGALAQVQRGQ